MKIKETLEQIDLDLDIDYQNDCVNKQVKYGAYTFDFLVSYERLFSCYNTASYTSPSEHGTDIIVTEVTELGVYDMNDNFIELPNNEIEELSDIIFKKLTNNNYKQ